MSFKEMYIADMRATSLNVDEFGETVTLTRGENSFTLAGCFDTPSLDGAAIGAEVEAIAHQPRLFVCAADLPEQKPERGDRFTLGATAFHAAGVYYAVDFAFEKDGSVCYKLQEEIA